MSDKVPVTVLTGYLGLIRHNLRQLASALVS